MSSPPREGVVSTKNVKDGWWLIYRRRGKRLYFSAVKVDSKSHMPVGQCVEGHINGKPLAYWVDQVRQQAKRKRAAQGIRTGGNDAQAD
jgi:hypothetical protein